MKTIVIEATQCPSCGKPMSAGSLAGLCPTCLLAQGLGTDAGGGRRAPFVPPPLEEVAKLFPQLEILSLLGAGGMGAVYQARQPALDRIVALKILPSHSEEGGNFTERFNREARALARLSHPNIVAVFEFGQAGALGFFIMEFVDGANLRQLEKAGRLAPREALQIIPQICDALQYAHDEGVVHRDIKPENVLVDRKGRVKIADFGLAKILGQDAESLRLTAEGQVMGTPHYMAPEQIEKPLTVDHRADIYSLGVVLYEMLTGDLPLGKFAPPSRKYQLDVRLDDVVLRALENDPARRYQNASEVKTQVQNIAGTPAPVAPASVILKPTPLWRQRRLMVASAILLLVVTWTIFQEGDSLLGLIRRKSKHAEILALPATTVATRDSDTGALKAVLPGGGTVELLAVSEENEAATVNQFLHSWWLPDGTPIPNVAYGVLRYSFATPPHKSIILGWRGLPSGASGPSFDWNAERGGWGHGSVTRNEQKLQNANYLRGAFPSSMSNTTLRVGFGLDSWRTILIRDRGGHLSLMESSGVPDLKMQILQVDPEKVFGFAQATLLIETESRDWNVRMIAVDTNGVEHRCERGSGSLDYTITSWADAFSGSPSDKVTVWHSASHLTPDAVKEFRVQARPLHWVEFRDVALNPRRPLVPVPANITPQTNPPGISRRKDPYAANDSEAKLIFSGTRAQLAQWPQLRFLAWQDEWKTNQPNGAWRPDGSLVTEKAELELLRRLPTSIMDVSAIEAGQRDPRFLHLWFSHPLFNQHGLNQVTLLDGSGLPIPLAADGARSSAPRAASKQTDDVSWLVCALSPGEGNQIPTSVTVRLRYVAGPLERQQEVAADYNGGMSLEGGQLAGIGQDADGRTFVAMALNTQEDVPRYVGIVAVTRHGRELSATGRMTSGTAERVYFNTPLSEIVRFRIGTRSVRTMEWPNVVLKSPPVH